MKHKTSSKTVIEEKGYKRSTVIHCDEFRL